MLTHPEVQRKAQEELRQVVGTDRLPTLNDRSRLPYIEVVLKELLRWMPVTPLGAHVRSPRRSLLLSGIRSVATLYGS